MIKKKVCLVGAYSVGKTSLVRQFVSGMFSDKYLTTVGVKIDQRSVTTEGGQEVRLMIWDLAGRDEFAAVQKSYLRGASGILYVADGTRRETLTDVREEMREIAQDHPGVPSLVLLNKCDLVDDWEVKDDDLVPFQEGKIDMISTSAKTEHNVAEVFDEITRLMISSEE